MAENPEQVLEQARAELAAWDEAHSLTSIDPGMQSMRFHESQVKRSKNLRSHLSRMRREAREREVLVENVEKAKRALRAAALPQKPVDPADLAGAAAVFVITRGHGEWHRVIRVNKATVTCWAPPGYDQPRIPHDRIFDVRRNEQEKR